MKTVSGLACNKIPKNKIRDRYSEAGLNLDICIDSCRLQQLINQRLLLAEDFRCLDLRTKQQVKRLLVRSASRT